MSYIDDEPLKILIAGLPNSGLRTIKAVVVDNNPPSELKKVVKKLDVGNAFRDVLQRRVLILRCGGDEALQDVLSKANDPIYEHVASLVFVLDISDQSTFSIAKYWFDNLIGHLHKFSPNARIFLLLHKIDLLGEDKNLAEYVRATKNLFEVEGIEIYIHETSVYDASIFIAFKDVMQKEVNNQLSVRQYLNQMLKQSCFQTMAVYSKDGLPMYVAGELTPVTEVAANVMLSTVGRISEELEKGNEVSSTILQMKKNAFMIFKTVNENCIFVGVSKRRPRLGEFLIEADQIVETLQNSL